MRNEFEKSINLTLTNNDNTIVLFYWQFRRFANASNHTSNRVRADAAVEISIVLCTHRMFGQNTLAIVDVRIVVDPWNIYKCSIEIQNPIKSNHCCEYY